MDAQAYDRWYETTRGRWVGEVETNLILSALAPRAGESLLDVGCGTGFFTRALGKRVTGRIVGVDVATDRIAYARSRDPHGAMYSVGDARALPYSDDSFDLVVSIAAVCFIEDEAAAIREIVRVTRRRFVIGLLNRRSLLWRRKGRRGGTGEYRGARWHTVGEARSLLHGLPVRCVRVTTAVHCSGGSLASRLFERVVPSGFPTGALILLFGNKQRPG